MTDTPLQDKVKRVFALWFSGLLFGCLFGIMAYSSVVVVLEGPLWVIGLTAFFAPFHYEDLKALPTTGRILRLLALFLLSSVLAGIGWFLAQKGIVSVPWLPDWPYFALPGMVLGFVIGTLEAFTGDAVTRGVDRFMAYLESKGAGW